MVTEDGLEDQLLATVVNLERPDLEAQRVGLLRDMNQMKIGQAGPYLSRFESV